MLPHSSCGSSVTFFNTQRPARRKENETVTQYVLQWTTA